MSSVYKSLTLILSCKEPSSMKQISHLTLIIDVVDLLSWINALPLISFSAYVLSTLTFASKIESFLWILTSSFVGLFTSKSSVKWSSTRNCYTFTFRLMQDTSILLCVSKPIFIWLIKISKTGLLIFFECSEPDKSTNCKVLTSNCIQLVWENTFILFLPDIRPAKSIMLLVFFKASSCWTIN